MGSKLAISRSEFDRAVMRGEFSTEAEGAERQAGAVLVQHGVVLLAANASHPIGEVINSILHRPGFEIQECDLYARVFPCCRLCAELVRAASPRRVFFAHGIATEAQMHEFEAHGVELIRVE
ncbi:hypothetical protein HYV30_02995 [Candidatus Kaiserbacteria bacterium]|nr:hypothetical protein [Candidatus Kaiserbacteria bacterium]